MKRDESSAVANAETGGVLGKRSAIDACAPVRAPLAMPVHRFETVIDTWSRWLRSQVEPIARSKHNNQAGAGAG